MALTTHQEIKSEAASGATGADNYQQLRERLEVLEDTLRAIRSGEVDALVGDASSGDQIYTLAGALEPYRIMVESMSEGAVTVAADGSIIYANTCFASMVAKQLPDIVGASFRNLVARADQDRCDLLLREGSQGTIRAELLLQSGDGRPRAAMISLSPLPGRETPCIAVVITDISERKQLEIALRDSEDKFRYLFEQSPVAKSITEASGLLHVNQAFCDLLGYTPSELHHLKWREISHRDDIARTQLEIDALLAGEKEAARFNKRYLHKNGAEVWADVTTALRRDSAGQPLYFMTTVLDVTERMKAELALQESELRFRHFFEKNGSVMLLIEPDSGLIMAANQAAADYYNYTTEQLIGMHIDQINALPAEEVARQRQLALDEKRNYFNFRHRLASGAIRDVEVYSTPVNVGHQPLLFSIVHDVTERVAADRRIEFLANHDRLTELPNRGLFYDRLAQTISRAIRMAEPITVFLLDLDDFKPINDRYGHEVGDVVLKSVAQRLTSCLRDMDTVARIGGDEFALILGHMGKVSDATALAQKIIARLSKPIKLQDTREVGIGVSIGIAMYPLSGSELDTLMDAADRAMYESKAHGKNSYTVYQPARSVTDSPWFRLDGPCLVGHAAIDKQHQMIADLLNELNGAAKQAQSVNALTALFDKVAQFTAAHFESEELLMQQFRYPDWQAHTDQHQRLLIEAQFLREKLASGGELLILQELKNWFLLHIESFDKQLASYLVRVALGTPP